ncbi:MAG: hypothetical protein C4525_06690 [Desulfarculus sp.]|nr:MAG: hypothetical protein C4525_06690 [Desulfarculus sp.]
MIVKMVLKEGKNIREVADGLGIGRRTVHKRLGRYQQGDATALENHISRPKRSPRRLKEDVLRRVQELRQGRKNSLRTSTVTLPLRHSEP